MPPTASTPLAGLRETLIRHGSYGDRLELDGTVRCIVPGCNAVVEDQEPGTFGCKAGHGADAITQAFFDECDAESAELGRDDAELEARRTVLLDSLMPSEDPIRLVPRSESMQPDRTPRWPTALEGPPSILTHFQGVVFLTGGPSAGKSWWAVGSSICAAYAGWRVLYLASEMHAGAVMARAIRYCDAEPPKDWQILEVNYGATVEVLVGRIVDRLDQRKLLIVLDSINSFVDQAAVANDAGDVHRIGPLKRLVMWALNVRRATSGQVSFLILSEKNAAGETKGRFGDHKADLVCTIEVDPSSKLTRKIAVVKSWNSQTGSVGEFGLDPKRSRLTKIGDAF